MTPSRPGLGRTEIVDAAIGLLDRDGPEAFSMRRLGAELGVDPMTVYHYLPSKDALFDAIVDEVWARTEPAPPDPGTPWREIAAGAFHALRAQLLAHPGVTPILGSRPAVTPHMLDLTDRTLGWLDAAGLPPASAMQLLDCLMGYTIGKVMAEVRAADDGDGAGAAFQALSPERHPRLVGALSGGYGWQPDEEFSRGLDAMLRGWPDG